MDVASPEPDEHVQFIFDGEKGEKGVARESIAEETRYNDPVTAEYNYTKRYRKPTWRPRILRLPTLCVIVTVTLGLIAILEYASRVLPAVPNSRISVHLPSTSTVAKRQMNFWADHIGFATTFAAPTPIIEGSEPEITKTVDFYEDLEREKGEGFYVDGSSSYDDKFTSYDDGASSNWESLTPILDEVIFTTEAAPIATEISGVQVSITLALSAGQPEITAPPSSSTGDFPPEDPHNTDTSEYVDASSTLLFTASMPLEVDVGLATSTSAPSSEETGTTSEGAFVPESSTFFFTPSGTPSAMPSQSVSEMTASSAFVQTDTTIFTPSLNASMTNTFAMIVTQTVLASSFVPAHVGPYTTTIVMQNPTDENVPDETLTSTGSGYVNGYMTTYETLAVVTLTTPPAAVITALDSEYIHGYFTTYETSIVQPNPTDPLGPQETLTSSFTSYVPGYMTTIQVTEADSTITPGTTLTSAYVGPIQSELFTPTPTNFGQITQTKSITYTTTNLHFLAIANSQNPQLNPTLLPQAKVEDNVVTVYRVIVGYPWWASVISAIGPVFVFVVYCQVWTIFYASVRLMQPFIVLSRTNGGVAKDIFFNYYMYTGWTVDPWRAFSKGHWLLFMSFLVYVSSGLLTPFASESLITYTQDCAAAIDSTSPNPCPPQLMIDLTAVRALQIILAFAALMTIILATMIHRTRQSGLFSDPSSLASIASMTHHPSLLEDFHHITTDTTSSHLEQLIGYKRYRLGLYQTSTGKYRYGFVPVSTINNPLDASTFVQTPATLPPAADLALTHSTRFARARQQLAPSLLSLAFLFTILSLFATILAYYQDSSSSPFNAFFNSYAFGPRFTLTLVGAIIASIWKSIHADIATKTVYADLKAGYGHPHDTICARRPTSAFTSFLPSLRHGHYVGASVAFAAMLSDLLVIALPGIPFARGELYKEFRISTLLSFAILAVMTLVLPAVIIWRFVKLPDLPRGTDTIASVISYVAPSQLVRDCEDMEFLTDGEREDALRDLEKRWCFGAFVGVEGVRRVMVEEDGGGEDVGEVRRDGVVTEY